MSNFMSVLSKHLNKSLRIIFCIFVLENFFWCGPFFKCLLNFATILLLFLMFLVFWPWGMWDVSSLTRKNPHPLHWKVKSYPLDYQGSPKLMHYWVIGGTPSPSLVIFPPGRAVSYLKAYVLKPHVDPGPASAIYPTDVFLENLAESGSCLWACTQRSTTLWDLTVVIVKNCLALFPVVNEC